MASSDVGASALRLPRLLAGRYRLERQLGAGGGGEVFEAVQLLTDRRVAIKLLHEPPAFMPDGGERFLREVRAAAKLTHPGIVQVFDADHAEDGRPFVVMELLSGETLRARLTRPVELGEVLGIFERLLEALVVAHAAGVVHRDLKPENVMLTDDGRVKLVDFGLARTRDSTWVTPNGALVGTPGYIAPEQALNAALSNPRSDLFSIGVMLYEAVAGQSPFPQRRQQDKQRAALDRAYVPLARAAGAPEWLCRLVDRCLEPKPQARVRDAAELIQALREGRHAAAPPARSDMREIRAARPRSLRLVVPGAAISLASIVVIALREPLLVPLVTGQLGSWVAHRFWTPFFSGLGAVGLAIGVTLTGMAVWRQAKRRDEPPSDSGR